MARRHVELCRRLITGTDRVEVSTVQHTDATAFDAGEPYPIDRQPFTFAGARRALNRARWARWLTRRLRARVPSPVDVVHCGNIRPGGYVAWWARMRTGVPYLVYVNGGDLLFEQRKAQHRFKRVAARIIFEKAAGIVAISAWTAELARETLDLLGVRNHPPIATIDLGTDPAQFHPGRETGALRARFALGDAPVALTVARLVPHKGQDVGLRALALLSREFPALRYVMVGSGPDEPRLRELARELGVADRAIIAGQLADDEIADAYATAEVYLGASRRHGAVFAEGFGISFVEASASGTPVVAGDSGGVRSAVRDGETGLVVPPTDERAVADAIAALLRNPARRAAMGRAGRAAVEAHYNWDRVALETLRFTHERVIAARSRRGAA